MKLVVVSTGMASPFKEKCLESVRSQLGCVLRPVAAEVLFELEHVYFEASEQKPLLGKTENFYRLVHALDPSDVVVCLDGDDWLSHDRVLLTVAGMHAAGAWVTYGSFALAADLAGFDTTRSHQRVVYDARNPRAHTRPYQSTAYRREPWNASHLKTFRAGLFQRIKLDDFMTAAEGDKARQWLFTTDGAMMLPMLEMAGPRRSRHCPEVLYVWNQAVSNSVVGGQAGRDLERVHGEIIRAKAPYAELPADLEAP